MESITVETAWVRVGGVRRPDLASPPELAGLSVREFALTPDQPADPARCRGRVVTGPPVPAAGPNPGPARTPLPVCTHRGPEVPGQERQENGLPHARTWFTCLHPDRPKGKYVCPCQGCGPKCSGYAATP